MRERVVASAGGGLTISCFPALREGSEQGNGPSLRPVPAGLLLRRTRAGMFFVCCPSDCASPLHASIGKPTGAGHKPLRRLLRRLFPSRFPAGPCPFGVDSAPSGTSERARQQAKTTVSLAVAGLGLAGSVDAGRSAWRVTRKTNGPFTGAFPPTCPRWVE